MTEEEKKRFQDIRRKMLQDEDAFYKEILPFVRRKEEYHRLLTETLKHEYNYAALQMQIAELKQSKAETPEEENKDGAAPQ